MVVLFSQSSPHLPESVMKKYLLVILVIFITSASQAQLKFLVEDFEGFEDGGRDLKGNGLYTYGNLKANVDSKVATKQTYSGTKAIRIEQNGKMEFGGWGKGITLNVELDVNTDCF